MRQLAAMAKAKQSDAWDRASLIANILANAHRDQKARPSPYPPHHFHPYRQGHFEKNGASVRRGGTSIFSAFMDN